MEENLYYQCKMVGYRHKKQRKELSHVVRHQLGNSLIKDWLARIGRYCFFALFGFYVCVTVLFAIGAKLVAGMPSNLIPYYIVLGGTAVCFLLAGLVTRKPGDPLRENLWPSEADVVTVSFYEDSMRVEDAYILSQMKLPTIRMVLESEKAYYLFVSEEHVLMICKDSFLQGDSEHFRDFIQQRSGKTIEYVS